MPARGPRGQARALAGLRPRDAPYYLARQPTTADKWKEALSFLGIIGGGTAGAAAVPVMVAAAGRYVPSVMKSRSALPDPGTFQPRTRLGIGDVLTKRGRYGRPSLGQQIAKTATSEAFRGARAEVKSAIKGFAKTRKATRRPAAAAGTRLAKRRRTSRRAAEPSVSVARKRSRGAGGESGQAFSRRMAAARKTAAARRQRDEGSERPARRVARRTRTPRRGSQS